MASIRVRTITNAVKKNDGPQAEAAHREQMCLLQNLFSDISTVVNTILISIIWNINAFHNIS